MDMQKKQKQIAEAAGEIKADLVLKNIQILNVFSHDVETADIAVCGDMIAGIGNYSGITEVDCTGKFACPGFIDGHIHLESSMVMPFEFSAAVVPHGTTSVVTDPHEIVNVAGINGIRFMMAATENLPLDVYFMLPSCVPATSLDESGGVFGVKEMESLISDARVIGLAEVMDFFGVIKGDVNLLEKIELAQRADKLVDGHAPFLSSKELNAYIAAGVRSDHECSCIEEAKEKMSRGQYIMVRQGTAAKNLQALMPLFKLPYCDRAMLVTDDKHPNELISQGHIDAIIREAVQMGADPICAVKMASYVPAMYFGLKSQGAIAPGYKADIVIVDDLKNFSVECVYKDGKLIAEHGELCRADLPCKKLDETVERSVYHSFALEEITADNFFIDETCSYKRVIQLTPHELLTKIRVVPMSEHDDIIKIAVFERHKNTGHRGIGFLGGYGLKKGAVATSVAHDSHNLIVAGTNDDDMALAANTVIQHQGGLAVAADGRVLAHIALPIAGIMSDLPLKEADALIEKAKNVLYSLGCPKYIDPFMTLAFVSLPVIPEVRLTTYGIVDVQTQQIVPAVFD